MLMNKQSGSVDTFRHCHFVVTCLTSATFFTIELKCRTRWTCDLDQPIMVFPNWDIYIPSGAKF
jgi:hypothetical protein